MAPTDATSATPVLRSISVIVPQAGLLSTASSLVTGEFAFSCSIQTEGAAIDSMSRQREVARVDKRFGGASIKNADVWEWGDAEKAIDLWAELAATRLADLQPGNAA